MYSTRDMTNTGDLRLNIYEQMQSQWFQRKLYLFCIIDRLVQSVFQKHTKKKICN